MKTVKLLIWLLFIVASSVACKKKKVPQVDFANEMRNLVMEISAFAKSEDPNFLIIPQNGAALATLSREQDGMIATDYLAAIDGQGQEDLFYGYQKDDKESPSGPRDNTIYYLDLMRANGVEILVTDYCSSGPNINNSYQKNETKGYISFVANERNLTNIPDYMVNVHNENSANISDLSQAKNFLYLINPTEEFATKGVFIEALKNTNYDLLILDRDFNDQRYTAEEIESLKWKNNGGKRLVICYMSIGEAEDYRSYWKKEWEKNKTSPDWLYKENRKWRGNYKVFYWMPEWKAILYGNPDSYLTSLLSVGFDGAYLDIIDAYDYYENL